MSLVASDASHDSNSSHAGSAHEYAVSGISADTFKGGIKLRRAISLFPDKVTFSFNTGKGPGVGESDLKTIQSLIQTLATVKTAPEFQSLMTGIQEHQESLLARIDEGTAGSSENQRYEEICSILTRIAETFASLPKSQGSSAQHGTQGENRGKLNTGC